MLPTGASSLGKRSPELPPKRVQELLGHSTIMMTFDLYGHLFPDKGDRGELNDAVVSC